MASGRPIIALLGKESEVARVVGAAECGYVFDQDDKQGIKDIVLRLYHDRQLGEIMGEKARKYFEKHFTKSIIMDEYFTLFEHLFQTLSTENKKAVRNQ